MAPLWLIHPSGRRCLSSSMFSPCCTCKGQRDSLQRHEAPDNTRDIGIVFVVLPACHSMQTPFWMVKVLQQAPKLSSKTLLVPKPLSSQQENSSSQCYDSACPAAMLNLWNDSRERGLFSVHTDSKVCRSWSWNDVKWERKWERLGNEERWKERVLFEELGWKQEWWRRCKPRGKNCVL